MQLSVSKKQLFAVHTSKAASSLRCRTSAAAWPPAKYPTKTKTQNVIAPIVSNSGKAPSTQVPTGSPGNVAGNSRTHTHTHPPVPLRRERLAPPDGPGRCDM
eukprot:m.35747 g.35747  ORF g.35747 m.35747 type:complete len:102 (-) comp7472_c0_seq1:1434-1739(-)